MKKKKILGNLFIFLGQLLVVAAILFTLYNMNESRSAGQASEAIRQELLREIEDETESLLEDIDLADDGDADDDEDLPSPEELEGTILPREEPPMESYTTMINGYPYIGILDIPALNISLPVMADWDYDRLRVSPCRYSGTPYNDDFVIAAHNYASHFAPLKWVDVGTEVFFTAMNGDQFHYTVANRETVQPYSVAEMVENDMNSESTRDWDLTMFTCNTGGETRCAVRCVRVEEK